MLLKVAIGLVENITLNLWEDKGFSCWFFCWLPFLKCWNFMSIMSLINTVLRSSWDALFINKRGIFNIHFDDPCIPTESHCHSPIGPVNKENMFVTFITLFSEEAEWLFQFTMQWKPQYNDMLCHLGCHFIIRIHQIKSLSTPTKQNQELLVSLNVHFLYCYHFKH